MTARETTHECLSDPEATVADGWCNHPGFRHRYGTKPPARETTLGALTAADLGKRVDGSVGLGVLRAVQHDYLGTIAFILGVEGYAGHMPPTTPVTVYGEEEA